MAFPGELYLAVGDKRYWSTGTRAFEDDNTTFVVMQADGNLVIYSQFCSTRPSFVCNPPNVRWQSGTAGHPGAVAVIQNDGNFVVYSAGQPRWQSGTAGVVVK
jgi:hypothetical protein